MYCCFCAFDYHPSYRLKYKFLAFQSSNYISNIETLIKNYIIFVYCNFDCFACDSSMFMYCYFVVIIPVQCLNVSVSFRLLVKPKQIFHLCGQIKIELNLSRDSHLTLLYGYMMQ